MTNPGGQPARSYRGRFGGAESAARLFVSETAVSSHLLELCFNFFVSLCAFHSFGSAVKRESYIVLPATVLFQPLRL